MAAADLPRSRQPHRFGDLLLIPNFFRSDLIHPNGVKRFLAAPGGSTERARANRKDFGGVISSGRLGLRRICASIRQTEERGEERALAASVFLHQ